MLEPTVPRWIKGIEYKSMTVLLSDFRKRLERESGGPVNRLDMNTADMLSDPCNFLGLSDENRRRVLGKDSARHVGIIETMPITPTIKY